MSGVEGGRHRPGWPEVGAVLALFGAFAVSVRPVLGPFVLFGLLLYLAWPWLPVPLVGRLVGAAAALLALWVLDVTGLLLAPFLLALLLAYVLGPVVDFLQRYVPRQAAIALLAVPLLGGLALLVFVLGPAVAEQLSQLIENLPSYARTVERWLNGLRSWLIGLGLPGLDERSVPALRDLDVQTLVRFLQDRRAEVVERGMDAVLGLGRGVGTFLALLGYLVLLPLLTYYLLRDRDRIVGRLVELVPHDRRERVVAFARDYDRLLNRYLRGQLLMAALVGIMIGVGLRIAGFPYALLLGLVAGVLNVVPYVGLLTSMVIAVVVALFSGAVLTSLLKLAVVFGVEQMIESVLSPRIVGESVGLHPVWVLLALALFSFFFGFVGLLLAVPAAVLVKLGVEAALRRYRASGWYLGAGGEP